MPSKKKQKVVSPLAPARQQLTPLQRSTIDAAFELERLPDTATRSRLAETLQLSSRQIQVYFQNRRQRDLPRVGSEGVDGADTLTTRHDGDLSVSAPGSRYPVETTELLALICNVTGFAVAELWVFLDEPAAAAAGAPGAAQPPLPPPQLACDRIFVTSAVSADARLVTGVGAVGSGQHRFSHELCAAVLAASSVAWCVAPAGARLLPEGGLDFTTAIAVPVPNEQGKVPNAAIALFCNERMEQDLHVKQFIELAATVAGSPLLLRPRQHPLRFAKHLRPEAAEAEQTHTRSLPPFAGADEPVRSALTSLLLLATHALGADVGEVWSYVGAQPTGAEVGSRSNSSGHGDASGLPPGLQPGLPPGLPPGPDRIGGAGGSALAALNTGVFVLNTGAPNKDAARESETQQQTLLALQQQLLQLRLQKDAQIAKVPLLFRMVCADPLAESYALERPAADPVDSPNEDGMVDAATGTLGADLKPPAAAAAAAVPAGSAAAPAGGHSPSAALCNKVLAEGRLIFAQAQSAEGLLGAGGPLVCSAVAMPLLRDTASIVGVLVFYHCQRREADAAVLDLLVHN